MFFRYWWPTFAEALRPGLLAQRADADPTHARFVALRRCSDHAGSVTRGLTAVVGAVVAKESVIIGRGWTQPCGRPDAEVEMLRRASDAVQRSMRC